jgi:hypothetical protein
MRKKEKEQIRAAFNAPTPKRKNEFLLSVNYPKSTRMDFLFAQIGYIRKRVWVVTFLIIIPLFFLNISEDVLGYVWIFSSLLPFIALAGITEIARSVSYNMAELESSCKFSFSDVVLSRLGILGCADMILFIVIITVFRINGGVDTLRLGIYLIVPFLLTCSLSLFALNRMRSKESVYICGGISSVVSISNAFFSTRYPLAFSSENMVFWTAAFCVLIICTAYEVVKIIRRTEEMQWSLSLTA